MFVSTRLLRQCIIFQILSQNQKKRLLLTKLTRFLNQNGLSCQIEDFKTGEEYPIQKEWSQSPFLRYYLPKFSHKIT